MEVFYTLHNNDSFIIMILVYHYTYAQIFLIRVEYNITYSLIKPCITCEKVRNRMTVLLRLLQSERSVVYCCCLGRRDSLELRIQKLTIEYVGFNYLYVYVRMYTKFEQPEFIWCYTYEEERKKTAISYGISFLLILRI